MLTQRAFLLGFVALCFYLIAVVNSLPAYFYALTWLSMGMLAASLALAFLSLIGLNCRLEISRARAAASLGDADNRVTGAQIAGAQIAGAQVTGAQVAIEISNAGTLNKTNVVLELWLEDHTNAVQTSRFLLEAVPSGAAIEAVLPLCGLSRGKYRLREARLVGSDVLGLFRLQKKVPGPEASEGSEGSAGDIVVGPAVLSGNFGSQGSGSGAVAGARRALSARHGEELRGTRPYAPGDDLRHVHWKSSARAGEIVVKEFEQTGQASALVVWDGAAGTGWGSRDFDSCEWGLILSASLCRDFLAGGTPCNFARLDAAPLLTQARALVGGELPASFVDALSGAAPTRETTLESALLSLPRLGSSLGASVMCVSASLSMDLVRFVRVVRARGARVQVLLLDGASIAGRARDRRFGEVGARFPGAKVPAQNHGTESVAQENFEIQCARLREIGAEVVRVVPAPGQNAETTLRAALRASFESPGIGRVAARSASGERNPDATVSVAP